MRKIVSVILTAAFIVSTLCDCSLAGVVEDAKGFFGGNKEAKTESKDTGDNRNAEKPAPKVELKAPGRNEILDIAEKYYKLARSKATAEELGYINQLIVWTPDFK